MCPMLHLLLAASPLNYGLNYLVKPLTATLDLMYRYLILVSITVFSQSLVAQETLKVKHYGVDQGLPQSTVWDILQDDFGFLWVSTADGLCRFDGYTFNTY